MTPSRRRQVGQGGRKLAATGTTRLRHEDREALRAAVRELQEAPTHRAGRAAPRRLAPGTFVLPELPAITAQATVVGPNEGKGPLRGSFDQVLHDELLGQQSWEQAEIQMLEQVVRLAVERANLGLAHIDCLLGGDLLNQIIAANFAARGLNLPFFGLFSACATWTEALAVGGMMLDGGYAGRVIAAVSSHNKTAERQYRFPTELGHQRPFTAQWTVTGAGAAVMERDASGPRLTTVTAGRVVDAGCSDPFDMGTAMAPAAADTLLRHFRDTGRSPEDYDLILTGDLAEIGHELCRQLVEAAGYSLEAPFQDCGLLMYDRTHQDVHAGASGTACSATVFLAHAMPQVQAGDRTRILAVATGALMSRTSYEQGESIPCIAHAVVIEDEQGAAESVESLKPGDGGGGEQ